jgi:thiol:disulfide interchange protein DsbD
MKSLMNSKANIFLLTIVLVLIISYTAVAQIVQPVKWSFDLGKLKSDEVELIIKASINEGWHVYSIDLPPNGPIPTSFHFEESDKYELIDDIFSSEPIEKYDNAFEMMLKYHDGEAIFKQKIKIKTNEPFIIKGELEFMACDDSRCLPPEYVEFAFDIQGLTTQQEVDKEEIKIAELTEVIIETEPGKPEEGSESLWAFFLIALGVGFIGILTPCVYPMIPMTVSFFMSASQNKLKAKTQAFVFGLSIIFIYTIIGVLVSVLFGAETIKIVSEHWITNVFFFVLFAIFAVSFFGMFEIVLPAWLTNKSDKQADKGGYIGAFFMALTLVLVSFSCTAPFIGGILVEAATGQVIKPTVGMFGFSLAFAIVFTVLAIFPSWMGKLPKSGGWLNSVKVVLAFIILAIGMKYLLVPNQVLGWGITREVYIAIWIVLFALMGFYLLGKIKFAHDSPVSYISVPRLVLIIITFSFVLYLFPGMFGAPLKAVSGYLPSESAWDLDEIIMESTKNISVVSTSGRTSPALCDEPKYADIFHLSHGLQGYFDLEQGMACAKQLNKPVFLDIKGHACTNCKVIEKNVWSDPQILERLRNDFVIVALYVDDKTKLPEEEWVTSTFDGKVKKTIGRKNTDYQITRFGVNAQPFYVILNHEGKKLTDPMAFEPNVDKYLEFLDKGIEAYKKSKN